MNIKKMIGVLSLLLFFGEFANATNKSKMIFIAINLNDCVNCNMKMYSLRQTIPTYNINFVFKNEDQIDSNAIIEKLEINKFNNSHFLFSDSLFNYFTKQFSSTITIFENHLIKYQQELKSLNIESFVSYLSDDNCVSKLSDKRDDILIYDDTTIIRNSHTLNRIKHLKNGREISFIADSTWLKQEYISYYGDDKFLDHYTSTLEITNFIPNIKNQIIHSILKNDTVLSFLVSAPFVKTTIKDSNNKKDTIVNIHRKHFIHEYNLVTNNFQNCYWIDDSIIHNSGYYITSSFYYVGQRLIISITSDDVTSKSYYLADYSYLPQKNKLKFSEIIKTAIPNNYIKYNIFNNFQQCLYDKALVALIFGNTIYDIENNKIFDIPLYDEYSSLEDITNRIQNRIQPNYFYALIDIRDAGENIDLLYRSKYNQIVYLKFNKENNKKRYKTVINNNIAEKRINKIYFFRDSIICLDETNNCLEIIRI